MMAQDEKPSRFERARYKLVDILDRSKDYQTALIGYAGEAYVAAPLTDDIGTVRNLVDALDPSTMPVAGNHAAAAIQQAEKLIEQAGLHAGDIIVLADSADEQAPSTPRARRIATGFDSLGARHRQHSRRAGRARAGRFPQGRQRQRHRRAKRDDASLQPSPTPAADAT